MDAWFPEVLSFIIGLFTGFGLKVVIDKRRSDRSVTTTVQERNRVGGHQAGRDITIAEGEGNE